MKQTTPTFDGLHDQTIRAEPVSALTDFGEELQEPRAVVSAVAIEAGLRLVESSVIVYFYVIIYMRHAVMINYKLFLC